jgi:Kef-type K+ transport system membrane component KefB
MDALTTVLITIGGLMMLGLATDLIGRHTPIPRVTLLLLFGIAIGPAGLNLLPSDSERWFPLFTNIALVMVGFLIGGALTRSSLERLGRAVSIVSVCIALTTLIVVAVGLGAVGIPLEVALLLAAIATATDPVAITDVVRESRARGPYSRLLLGVVILDDAWGLIILILVLAVVQAGQGASVEILLTGLWEIAGAALLGTLLGVPMAYMTGRLARGEPLLVEALGMVLLCAGLAMWLDVSVLLSAMVMGAVVTNLARHHRRPFHAIEGIEWPFIILFFVLAGAAMDADSLWLAGPTLIAYLVLRVLGRVLGGWVGGRLADIDPLPRRWLGIGLVPQAGVALGMALLASQRVPSLAEIIIPVVVASTVIFEIAGPVLTRLALHRVGESRRGGA